MCVPSNLRYLIVRLYRTSVLADTWSPRKLKEITEDATRALAIHHVYKFHGAYWNMGTMIGPARMVWATSLYSSRLTHV